MRNTGQESKLQQRIEELESKLSFQEHSIAALEDSNTSQQQQIEDLRTRFELLTEQYRALLQQLSHIGDAPSGLADEKPPHY